MGHSVGDAADRAVKNSEKVKLSEMTPEQSITELRKNLKAGLWIPSHQIEALLAAYDKHEAKIQAKLDDELADMDEAAK